VLVGPATKFADRIHEATKVYDALVRFGSETATDDREGGVTRESAVPALDADAIESALAPFRGVIAQVPPQYAALKVSGVSSWCARQGPTFALSHATSDALLAPRRTSLVSAVSPSARSKLVMRSRPKSFARAAAK